MHERAKVWVVTGGAGVLGQALIRCILASGDDCLAIDKDKKGLEKLHDSLEADGFSPPALYPMDLIGASIDDYEVLGDVIKRTFGQIDHLVHAATFFKALRPLMHQPADEWLQITHIGVHAPLFLTQSLIKLIHPSRGSSITWITDPVCLDKPAHWGAYGLSQASRTWLAEALALELGPKAPRSRAISVGEFYSPVSAQAWPAKSQQAYPDPTIVAQQLFEEISKGE